VIDGHTAAHTYFLYAAPSHMANQYAGFVCSTRSNDHSRIAGVVGAGGGGHGEEAARLVHGHAHLVRLVQLQRHGLEGPRPHRHLNGIIIIVMIMIIIIFMTRVIQEITSL
jgi:hypothetical protein